MISPLSFDAACEPPPLVTDRAGDSCPRPRANNANTAPMQIKHSANSARGVVNPEQVEVDFFIRIGVSGVLGCCDRRDR